MADAWEIRLTPRTLGKKMDRAAGVSNKEMRRAVSLLATVAWEQIVQLTPVGATGQTRGGYAVEGPRRVGGQLGRWEAAVVNPVFQHDFAESGRRPGRMPPPQALEAWVGTKLGIPVNQRKGVAFLVARAIGRRGTKGAHMVEKGVKRTRRRMRPVLRRLNIKVVRSL